jgi:hypothetical protein
VGVKPGTTLCAMTSATAFRTIYAVTVRWRPRSLRLIRSPSCRSYWSSSSGRVTGKTCKWNAYIEHCPRNGD